MKIIYKANQIETVAKQLLESAKTKTWLFYGDMGVGKTTLIKALVKELNSDDEVSSPTFSIVNEYKLSNGKIFHFDLYRINDTEEAYNFGIEDYLDANHWIFIEWPEKIETILESEKDIITIELNNNNDRVLKLN